MKKILLPLLIVFLFSCSRQQDRILNGDPEISFDISGNHYAHIGEQTAASGSVGVFATKIPGIIGGFKTIYSFAGYTNNTNAIQLIISMTPPDTLKPVTYHIVQGMGFNLTANSEIYGCLDNNDYLDVTITTYQNGTVNGRFAGILTKIISVSPNVTQKAMLTNGLIKNVQIRY